MQQEPFKDRIRIEGPQFGMWVATGSAYCAEISAGSGLDWLLIDSEHVPNDLRSVLAQLQAIEAYPIWPVVRLPSDDAVAIKQYLDLGVSSLMIPMVESVDQAESIVRAVRYPPNGIRGVGSALGRASRWNRNTTYLKEADESITLIVQIESERALRQASEIATVDGIDGVFFGPADLAASLGFLGQQEHPDVVRAVEQGITAVTSAGVLAGVNAVSDSMVERYVGRGCSFVLVGSDVSLLARGSEELASKFVLSDRFRSRASG